MSLIQEPNAQAVAQYGVPYKGTWRSLAAHTTPVDAVYESMNTFVRNGKLRTRPGLKKLNDTLFDSRILGGGLVVSPTAKIVLAISRNGLYELSESSTAWSKTSSLVFSASDNIQVDMALLETSGVYVALIAAHGEVLKAWNALNHITTDVASAPHAKSVCIAGRRVVTLVHPHTITWSSVFDYTTYVATTRVAQTNDVGICVRGLGSLGFVVYKERSIYPARAQGGNDTTAFAFSEPITIEGPAGIHSVVVMPKLHMYMTRNGRIAIFDGVSNPTWVADGLWLYLQDDIHPGFAHRIFGVFDYRLNSVVFFYPRKTDPGTLQGMVIVQLPFEGLDLQQSPEGNSLRAFLGYCAKPCSYGCEIRFNNSIDRSVLFTTGDLDTESFIFDETYQYDDNEVFPCSFTTGLSSMPEARHTLFNVESFFEKGYGYGEVELEAIYSDALEEEAGYTVDLNNAVINLELKQPADYRAFNVKARFVGLKYTWPSTTQVRYSGAVIYKTGR